MFIERKAAGGWCLIWLVVFFTISHPSVSQQQRNFSFPDGISEGDFEPGVIVIKIKNAASNTRSKAYSQQSVLNQVQQVTASTRIQPIFSDHVPAGGTKTQARQHTGNHPLANIYKIYINSEDPISQKINQLLQLAEIEYAEPYYLMKPLEAYADEKFIPNDPEAKPNAGKQDFLTTIKAYEAWQIEKGNSNIVIGILDTGVGLGHQDLMGNLYYNLEDPLNGADDDGDGFVDNYLGWDWADNDNSPNADKDQHGTMVTGMAAATTNNGKGIAGAGFQSSYMPVKIFRSADNVFWGGYEAIVYAADQGCKVINLSWGAPNAYSSFGQDIINYAVLEKDAVIVAAAGNSGKKEYYYPASYNHVLSVAVSDAKDNRVAQTTYNFEVDLMAPGNSNYTTANQDKYQNGSGSSLSSPLVAGTAALVRARFPELNARQVMEKIRLSSDNIYAVGNNKNYKEQLGFGRLNMKKALQEATTPALRMNSFAFYNHLGAYAFADDTVRMKMNFINYLKPTSAQATVTLSTLSPYVTLLDSVMQVGVLNTMGTAMNEEQPFSMYLHHNLPINTELVFRLAYKDEHYTDYQYFRIRSSPTHILIDNGVSQLPIGDNGDLSYNPYEFMGGKGMVFQQGVISQHMGLILATDEDRVSDNLINDFTYGSRNADFKVLENFRINASELAGLEARSAFSDEYAFDPLGLRIEQTWLFDNAPNQKPYFIGEYKVIHTTAETLTGLKLGVFADWNLGHWLSNKAYWDATHRLGYVSNGDIFSGVALLTPQAETYHAIDLKNIGGNTAEIGSIFSDSAKYSFLSGHAFKGEAGIQGLGNDVAFVVGGETDTLSYHQSTTYAFAWVTGHSLEALQEVVTKAQQDYNNYLLHPPTSLTVNVCSNHAASVRPAQGSMFRFYSDPLGENLLLEGSEFTTWPISKDTSLYVADITEGYEGKISRVHIGILEPQTAFIFDETTNHGLRNDTLFLDDSDNFTIDLVDQSENAVSWRWDFNNGFKSNLQYPKTRYTQPGTYPITLTTYSEPGCSHSFTRMLTVVRRSSLPAVSDVQICAGSNVTLQATNTEALAFYADAALEHFLYQGSAWTVGPLWYDTVFYVVNREGEYESLPKAVAIEVIRPTLEIDFVLDTVSLTPKYTMNLFAEGISDEIQTLQWYINEAWMGSQETITYDFSPHQAKGDPFTVRLAYSIRSGESVCDFTATKTFEPAATDKPALSANYICQNEKVIITPEEGEVFYFYTDNTLDTLIHKGRRLEVNTMDGIHTFFITRMDGLKESEAAQVTISNNLFANFTMSADTLYLSEHQSVTLAGFTTDQSDPKQISWHWDMGDGQLINKSNSFSHYYDTAGIYQIRLVAYTADGCMNTIKKMLVVEKVAASDEDLIHKALKIYPNPTTGKITIENTYWSYEPLTVQLLSLHGNKMGRGHYLYANMPLTINLAEIPQNQIGTGLYILQISHQQGSVFKKILISPTNP